MAHGSSSSSAQAGLGLAGAEPEAVPAGDGRPNVLRIKIGRRKAGEEGGDTLDLLAGVAGDAATPHGGVPAPAGTAAALDPQKQAEHGSAADPTPQRQA